MLVLERQPDVVEVDDDPGREPRQHLEHDRVDVASDLDRVGGVDEEQVAGGERFDSSRGRSWTDAPEAR